MKDIKEMFSKNLTKINMKTSGFLTVNKLQTYIDSIEKEIQEKKMEMANGILEQWKINGQIPGETIEKILKEIQEKERLIEEQREAILQVEEEQKRVLGRQKEETAFGAPICCSYCGASNAAGAKFCKSCGNPVEN